MEVSNVPWQHSEINRCGCVDAAHPQVNTVWLPIQHIAPQLFPIDPGRHLCSCGDLCHVQPYLVFSLVNAYMRPGLPRQAVDCFAPPLFPHGRVAEGRHGHDQPPALVAQRQSIANVRLTACVGGPQTNGVAVWWRGPGDALREGSRCGRQGMDTGYVRARQAAKAAAGRTRQRRSRRRPVRPAPADR